MFGFGRKKQDLFDACFPRDTAPSPRLRAVPEPAAEPEGSGVFVLSVEDLPASRVRWGINDGEKFAGGYGPTSVLFTDYWTLRARSLELFHRNLYARGIIRRLVTNEISTGLSLECTPEEKILGYKEEALADWTEDTENRFAIWARTPALCDQEELRTFGAIQARARRAALICGDVLVTIQHDRRTGLPRVKLVSGNRVQTPLEAMGGTLPSGNRVVHGVELDATGRQVAYWVRQDDFTAKRLPAFGEKSGRRLAFLYYGTEVLEEEHRGQPILGLMLQSLREIDRYRDSVQRKATLNAFLAMFIKRTTDKAPSRALSAGGGAVRKSKETAIDAQGNERSFHVQEQIPGLVLDELQVGEEPHGFRNDGTDEKFGDFEKTIVQLCAWGLQIPPESLTLSFNSNYSASQAAINEFKGYLELVRTDFGDSFCQPVFTEWILTQCMNHRVQAPGLLEAWRDPAQYELFAAWTATDWAGQIKPAVDMSRLVSGYEKMIDLGLCTRARAARETTGLRFSKVIKQLQRENAAVYEANRLVAELAAVKVGAAAAYAKKDSDVDEEATVEETDPASVDQEPTDAEPSDKQDDKEEEDEE